MNHITNNKLLLPIYFLIFFLAFTCKTKLYAQKSIQSIESNYKKAKDNTESKYDLAIQLTQEYFKLDNQDEIYKIIDQNIQIATKSNNYKYLTYFYSYKAFIAMSYDSSNNNINTYLSNAKKFSARTNDNETIGFMHFVQGEFNYNKNESFNAAEHYIKAIKYFDQAAPSKKLIPRKISNYRKLALVYARLGEFDLQDKFSKQSLEMAIKQEDKQILFDAYMAVGYLYENHLTKTNSNKFKVEAEKNYLSALKLLEDYPYLNSPSNFGYVNINLANLYYSNFDKTYRTKVQYHAKEALNSALKNNIQIQMAAAYGLLSEIETENKNYYQAKIYLNSALAQFKKSNNSQPEDHIYLNILMKLSEIDELEGNYKYALFTYKEYIQKFEEIYNKDVLKTTKELEAKFDKERNEQRILTLGLETEKNQQHILLMQAKDRQQLRDIENLRLKEENQRRILELNKLEAEKNTQALKNSELESTKRAQALKLSQLESLKKSQDLKSYIKELKLKEKINNYYIFIIIVILLFIGLVGYSTWQRVRNMEQKEKMHLLKMEQEKQNSKISTLTALLKGQEDERSRIARDLHDGLGGLLSGTKIQLTHLHEKINRETKNDLSKSINQLDSAVDELRRVAHNLMPDLLVKYGLEEALIEYANRISNDQLEIDVQFLSYTQQMEKETQLIVYRIIQELVNNSIKHACPSQIIIQLVEDTDKYYVTVEDDGKGFDITNQKLTNSAGLHNIKSRVEFLKGKLDIHSQLNLGTSIEFNFQKN